MSVRRSIFCCFALSLVLLLVAPVAAHLGGQCSRLCQSEIARCRSAGFTRTSCRRVLINQCQQSGGSACVFMLNPILVHQGVQPCVALIDDAEG